MKWHLTTYPEKHIMQPTFQQPKTELTLLSPYEKKLQFYSIIGIVSTNGPLGKNKKLEINEFYSKIPKPGVPENM